METMTTKKRNNTTVKEYEKPAIEVYEIELEGVIMDASDGGFHPRGQASPTVLPGTWTDPNSLA